MDISDIHKHIRFEHSLSWIHLLENTETYFKVSNKVLFGHHFIKYLEVPTIVLFTLRLVSKWDHKIVNYNLLFTSGVIHHRLSVVRLVIKNVGC